MLGIARVRDLPMLDMLKPIRPLKTRDDGGGVGWGGVLADESRLRKHQLVWAESSRGMAAPRAEAAPCDDRPRSSPAIRSPGGNEIAAGMHLLPSRLLDGRAPSGLFARDAGVARVPVQGSSPPISPIGLICVTCTAPSSTRDSRASSARTWLRFDSNPRVRRIDVFGAGGIGG